MPAGPRLCGFEGSVEVFTIAGDALFIFLCFKIVQLKNWARRVYILLFVGSIGGILLFFLGFASGEQFRLCGFLGAVQYLPAAGAVIFDFIFVPYLFRTRVRSSFTSKPPKLYQRILLVFLALFSFSTAIGSVFRRPRFEHEEPPAARYGWRHTMRTMRRPAPAPRRAACFRCR